MPFDAYIPVFDLAGTLGFLLAAGIGLQNYRDTEIAQVFWLIFTFTAGLGVIWLGLVSLEWLGVQSVMLDIFSTSLQAVVIGVFAVGSMGALATVDNLKRSRSQLLQQRRAAETARDEAERRKRALEDAQELLGEVEEMASVGGWEYTPETDSLRVTEGTERIIETSPIDFSELSEYFHPDDEQFREAVKVCVTEGTPFDREFRLITATGKEHWVRTHGAVAGDRSPTVVRGVILKISDRKEREQRLMVLNRVLRHDLRNKLTLILGHTSELEESLADLDIPGEPDRQEMRNQLKELSRSADESRVDLTLLQGLAEQLREFSPARFRHHVRHIREHSVAVSTLSEKVHEFQKAARAERQPQETEINPIAHQVRQEYSERFPDATIELRGTHVSVRGFSEGIRLLLGELIENAIVHNDTTEPVIVIEAEKDREERVHLSVKDTGPGLPPDEREVLATGKETPLSHGSGIGLWTVRWLMARYDGSVNIRDNDPTGTIVELTFPTPQPRQK